VGEVQNNGSETAKFVEVSATLYGSNNKVIRTEFTFTKPSEIVPGQKAPFEITVGTDKLMGGGLSIIDQCRSSQFIITIGHKRNICKVLKQK
jgi:hypothetical protein